MAEETFFEIDEPIGWISIGYINNEIVLNKEEHIIYGNFHIQNANSYHSRLKSCITYGLHGAAT